MLSSIERFRFYEYLYDVNSQFFVELSSDEFTSMQTEFYANQSVILTLPFRKGGLRR
jgi:hypothetical protein